MPVCQLPFPLRLLISHVWLFVAPWTAACQASLSTISRSLLKFMSVELVTPSNHFILCCPLLLPSIFPSIKVFSKESVFRIRWPKYWSFNFSISPSNDWLDWSGLISFRRASLLAEMVKTHLQCRRPRFRKTSWTREGLPTPVFLPGEFPGQRSQVGYSPWGPKESETTEWISLFL